MLRGVSFSFPSTMSHYSVLILGNDPEIQLYPYAELNLSANEVANDPRSEFLIEVPAGEFDTKARQIIAENEAGRPELADYYRKLLAEGSFEYLFKLNFGGEKNDAGDWGHYHNPVARWDWFVLGGRWPGQLILKPGRSGVLSPESEDGDREFSPLEVDQARFGDVDWATTRQHFSPFAVLKRGQWHEQGRPGWFGATQESMSDEAWEVEITRLLVSLPKSKL
jgi:hypothetical protein